MRNAVVLAGLFVAAVLFGTAASAQTTATPPASQPPPTSGPLVLERIHDGWVLAPDFKVTDVDNRTGELAGAYGGRLIDGTILIGGAGYWLANDARDFKMSYGGLVVGWQSPELGRIRFGGRGLLGAGSATLGFDVTMLRGGQPNGSPLPGGDIRFGVRNPGAQAPAPSRAPVPVQTIRARVLGRNDFMVFEPTANISARLTHGIGVSCGVGYRVTSQTDVLRDRLNGPSASLALQFGF